jgi:two-component system, cell cycle sensor histidine kinase and response regulator CckA
MTPHPHSPLAAALNATVDGVALFDASDSLVFCNDAYRRLCAPIADLIVPGVEFATLVRASFARGFARADDVDAAIAVRLAQHCCLHSDIEIVRGERTLLVRESRIPEGGILQLLIDVTALRVRDREQSLDEKMMALATLSSGLAHDINNMLAMIRGYAELAGTQVGADHAALAHLARIVANVDRAAGITRSLLTFSRHRPSGRERVDVTALLEELQPRLAAILPPEIALEIATREQLVVEGDPAELRDAIMQIAINARDAMPQGGVLRLALEEIPPGAPDFPLSARPHSHVRLTISDTGRGMDAATRARLFEPFFTTKPPRAGAGLGLAMVHGAITRMEGRIAVDSQPDAGTTFRIYLPCAEIVDCLSEDLLVPANDPLPLPRRRRILLAEDEPELRELLRLALEAEGHSVVAVANGSLALDLARSQAFDLLVTDISMPELDGLSLATHLRHERPELRIVYMTGDPGRIGASAADLPRDAIVLWKPFAPSELASVVAA